MAPDKRSPDRGKTGATRKSPNLLRDALEVVVPAFLIFLVVKTFLFEARWVPSPSMVPTIELRDRFLENKMVYWFRNPQRGEIIVFHPPAVAVPPGTKAEDFVKRVVGLPGEVVEIRAGRVYIKKPGEARAELLPEPYVKADRLDYLDFGPFVLGKDQYLVLGDNRRQSRDSRYWGYVPRKSIDGKAIWRFWPPGRMSLLH